MLEALRCRFCGGFINPRTYMCEYCGTVYMKPRGWFNEPPRELIVVKEAPLITYAASVAVDDGLIHYDPQYYEHYVRTSLSNKFAEAITENMVVDKERDPIMMQNIYRARLRVVKPNYKWGT